MLTCSPQSVFSWDYDIAGTSAGNATVNFNYFTEQGGITLGTDVHTVQKNGLFSGHWSLMLGNQAIADAHKPNALFRLFQIEAGDLKFSLGASSAFTRGYDLLDQNGQPLGRIEPDHMFTRRASIDCGPEIPELEQLFAFWLVILTWRRTARSKK